MSIFSYIEDTSCSHRPVWTIRISSVQCPQHGRENKSWGVVHFHTDVFTFCSCWMLLLRCSQGTFKSFWKRSFFNCGIKFYEVSFVMLSIKRFQILAHFPRYEEDDSSNSDDESRDSGEDRLVQLKTKSTPHTALKQELRTISRGQLSATSHPGVWSQVKLVLLCVCCV